MKGDVKRVAGAGLTCLCALALGAGAQNPPALPDTRPGRLMAQWLKPCDAADLALMKKWGEENLNEQTLQRVGAERFARQTSADCARR